MNEHENGADAQKNSCCNISGGCSSCLGSAGWKWSLFTLAALIIAGVTTATVLAGDKSDQPQSGKACVWSKMSSCGDKAQGASGEAEYAAKSCNAGEKAACSEAKAQGVSGEKESAGENSCPVTGKSGDKCCGAGSKASAQGAAGEKEAKEGKSCCATEKSECSKTRV